MKNFSSPLIISLLLVSLMIGVGIGYYFNPSYQQTMYQKTEMGLGEADRFLDLRYLDAMAAHHRAAILLADQIVDKTQRPEVKALAQSIQNGEKRIDELYQWKKDWYKNDRKVADPEVANLGTSDDKIDLRFLNALIAHHESGIEMTKEVRVKSSRNEILNNADLVEQSFTNSLKNLKEWRKQWYGID